MESIPFHLLLPLSASVLFVIGLMLIKRASSLGVGSWTITFVANCWAALVFSGLVFVKGNWPPITEFWQPAIVGLLYIMGQSFTFLALHNGDVSVATPLLSIKVLLVALFLVSLGQQELSILVWTGAALATVGIALVQRTNARPAHGNIGLTILFAILAATSFSLFDVLVQSWAPGWGATRFVPALFGIALVMSLGFLPWIDKPSSIQRQALWPLVVGTLFIALQALCIVLAIAVFGDAVRVNIVYAMRGLWGVLLAWSFARLLKSNEALVARNIMYSRLVGASFLTVAVILAILAGS